MLWSLSAKAHNDQSRLSASKSTRRRSRHGYLISLVTELRPVPRSTTEAYHGMAWFFQKISMGNFLIPHSLPMFSFEKSQTKKKTKATTKRMTTKTTKTKAIRSEVAWVCS
jgi:hypothetical protein